MAKDKTAVERNRRLREKYAADGFVLVQVRVPNDLRASILYTARKMRDGEYNSELTGCGPNGV